MDPSINKRSNQSISQCYFLCRPGTFSTQPRSEFKRFTREPKIFRNDERTVKYGFARTFSGGRLNHFKAAVYTIPVRTHKYWNLDERSRHKGELVIWVSSYGCFWGCVSDHGREIWKRMVISPWERKGIWRRRKGRLIGTCGMIYATIRYGKHDDWRQ